MVIDRNGTFHIWKRPEMDLSEKDRFHMPEMEYSLGTKNETNNNNKINKKNRLREYDRWGHPVIRTVQRKGKREEEICSHGGSNPSLPGVALLRQPLG